ncbi:MAG: plastocyanin/azurin family copper-binding protein [Solirubrobacteraceae bacterium]
MRRLLALAAVLALAAPAAASTTVTVRLKNIDVSKPTVRIAVGDSVRWLFRDAVAPHNVTSEGKRRFKSSTSMTSGSYTVRFAKAGTYRWYCTIHPSMTGRVIVG